METNEKSPQKRAAKAQIETENLQSSEKVDNFAKILYIRLSFRASRERKRKTVRQISNVGCITYII